MSLHRILHGCYAKAISKLPLGQHSKFYTNFYNNYHNQPIFKLLIHTTFYNHVKIC